MNRSILAVLTVAGIASGAMAQDTFKLDVQVSNDAGSSWHDDVNANPGDAIMVRFVCDWNKPGALSWGGCTLTQLNVTGSDAADTADNFAGKLQPSTQTFKLYNATNKIDRLDNAAGSIQMAQLPLGNGGSADKPITVFSFLYHVAGDSRVITLDAPAANMTLATVFTSSGGTSAQIGAAGRSIDGARINVTPAPGALALVGLGGLVAGRRRR